MAGGEHGPGAPDPAVARWFLTAGERGNDATDADRLPLDAPAAWAVGNDVSLLVHGASYFRRLHEDLCAATAGDHVFFTDWSGDADQRLLPEGPTVGEALCDLAGRGVEVRALLWRSHAERLRFTAAENRRLGRDLNEAGGEALLDQRVRLFGSHHQKLFVIRYRDAPERDVAFVGGIDLCHGRRDDAEHAGDPQQPPMDPRYHGRAPWHDASLRLRGPVVGDVLRSFAQRWNDPHPLDRRTPYHMALQRLARMPRHPRPLPPAPPDPPPAGPCAVQVLRTYGARRPGYPFAPQGERSVARAYVKAFGLAAGLVYVEDQYLWSGLVVEGLCRALRRSPRLRVIAVVPRYPDDDGYATGPANRLGQLSALRLLSRAGRGRVAVYDLENASGTPIYVHAKVVVVDDVWAMIGSDNLNRRSWTHDSELSIAVLDDELDQREPLDPAGSGDGARRFARDLRIRLMCEHLQLDAYGADGLVDPADAVRLMDDSAEALDAWHAAAEWGDVSTDTRPPGHLRGHATTPVTGARALWASLLLRWLVDPDGRPIRDRLRGRS